MKLQSGYYVKKAKIFAQGLFKKKEEQKQITTHQIEHQKLHALQKVL